MSQRLTTSVHTFLHFGKTNL
ncbi:hypothetical protein AERO9AM_30592 [Aeromicrobium sp. 9AM]|nr:hypothetical protein AERO9AM_30592 [Aeromicrobium sp. 9AM]